MCIFRIRSASFVFLVPYRTLAQLAQKKIELAAPFIVVPAELSFSTLVIDHIRSCIASAALQRLRHTPHSQRRK